MHMCLCVGVCVSVCVSERELKYGEYCTSTYVFTSQSGIGVIYSVNTCILSSWMCECVCLDLVRVCVHLGWFVSAHVDGCEEKKKD